MSFLNRAIRARPKRRGWVARLVRRLAANRTQFTLDDLPVSIARARSICHTLRAQGELVLIRKGQGGRGRVGGSTRSIYAKTAMLRDPRLTNRPDYRRLPPKFRPLTSELYPDIARRNIEQAVAQCEKIKSIAVVAAKHLMAKRLSAARKCLDDI